MKREPVDEPFRCGGCHGGDFPDFDHLCDALDVREDEVPHAFAAWLSKTTEWDGDYAPTRGTGGAE